MKNKIKTNLISLNDFLNNKLDTCKYKGSYLKNKKLLQQFYNKAKQEWFKYVFDQAKKGVFVDWKTLNDIWNLEYNTGEYIYRILHDIPNGNFDTKWTSPKNGEKAKGYKTRWDVV